MERVARCRTFSARWSVLAVWVAAALSTAISTPQLLPSHRRGGGRVSNLDSSRVTVNAISFNATQCERLASTALIARGRAGWHGTRMARSTCPVGLRGLAAPTPSYYPTCCCYRPGETTGSHIADLGEEHGHRVLRVCGKGGKMVLVPLSPAVARAVQRAASERTSGPLLLNRRGARMDRHAVTRRLRQLAAVGGCPSAADAPPHASAHVRRHQASPEEQTSKPSWTCGCRERHRCHAASVYSWMTPPIRSCRRILIASRS